MPRSTSTARRSLLSNIFKIDPAIKERHRQFDVLIARLCVLFEDLRLELMAIEAKSLPALDVLDPETPFLQEKDIGKTRQQYFLRRSVGTLFEFSEALIWINECREMATVKHSWGTDEALERWREAIAFFQSKAPLIEKIRNDIGGHFGQKAAYHAVSEFLPTATGKIERRTDDRGRTKLYLPFVGEIAATAMTRHLEGATTEEKVERLFKELLMPAYGHATVAVQMIAVAHLWRRFGR